MRYLPREFHVSLSAARARKSALETIRIDQSRRGFSRSYFRRGEAYRQTSGARIHASRCRVQQSHLSMVLLCSQSLAEAARLGLPSPATKKRHRPSVRCVYIDVESPVEREKSCCFTYLLMLTKVCKGTGKKEASVRLLAKFRYPLPSAKKEKWVVCPGGLCTTNCPKGNALWRRLFVCSGRLIEKKSGSGKSVPAIARRRGTHDESWQNSTYNLFSFFFLYPPLKHQIALRGSPDENTLPSRW